MKLKQRKRICVREPKSNQRYTEYINMHTVDTDVLSLLVSRRARCRGWRLQAHLGAGVFTGQ